MNTNAMFDIPPFLVVADEDQAIARATAILEKRLKVRDVLATPNAAQDYLKFRATGLEHEVFAVLYLDVLNRVITYEPLFRGTISQTAVYPREVVKRCLALNAAAVILHHNHPSGCVQPSRADENLTQILKAALALVDVRVMDHVITAESQSVSMAERGLL